VLVGNVWEAWRRAHLKTRSLSSLHTPGPGAHHEA
jgi:hypothetical protein